MSGSVTILGSSAITPLGFTPEENYRAVLEGRSELRLHKGEFGVREPFVASLFNREDVRREAMKEGIQGFGFFDTIVLLATSKAVREAGIDPSSEKVQFVLSTIKGDGTPLCSSASVLGEYFRCKHPVTVVSNACISGLSALVSARRMLLCRKDIDYIVVVGAEVQSRFIVTGFQSLKALSEEPCRPFDADRTGLNLGEASVAVVLGRDGAGWQIVQGVVRNDANHISGPSRTGEGSYNALRALLPAPEDLAFISVHGTATAYNDEMESIALERAGLSDVPVSALKGIFGHTMGAAGILESIVSMKAAESGVILPTAGFSTQGTSRPVNLSSSARRFDASGSVSFIKLLSGFGGVNGAVLFCRA